MAPRKVTIREMFGSNQTAAGKAAVRRAMEYAAREQQKVLEKSKAAREINRPGDTA